MSVGTRSTSSIGKHTVSPLSSAEVAIQLQRAPRPRRIALDDAHPSNFQRRLDESRVRAIVRTFNINKVRAPLMAEDPDNGYVIVDGQHTTEALRRKGFKYWPHVMVAQMSPKEQIKRFIEQKDNERALKPDEKLHAAAQGYIEPGGAYEPEFLRGHEILQGIKDAGWDFKSGHKKTAFSTTITLSTGVEEVYDEAEKHKERSGRKAVTQMLKDAEEIWPADARVSGSPNLHRALGKLERAYGPLTEEEKVILSGIPSNTFGELTAGRGSQPDKRDKICEYMIKALGKRRNKNYYAA